MSNPEPWYVDESEESHNAGMELLFDKERGEGVFATNGGFPSEDFSLEKLKEVHAKMEAMTDEHHKQLGEALAKSGMCVICDSTLKDHEFRVSPAVHAAALSYAVANPKDFLIRMPKPSALQSEEPDSE